MPAKNNNLRLVIGGPMNGERINWTTELTDGPENHHYRLVELKLDGAATVVYVFHKLSDEQALQLLQEDYFGV